ncbi:MAG TPA: VWA domain-containing protein [Pyrinomonadaceae bacterium]|nr:VWA domain-containing protein [Pyrinomonadaceae bacterium]
MRSINLQRLGLFAFSIFFLSVPAFAQTATPTPKISEEDQVIKVDSRLVVVPVSVVNANGDPVQGLKPADFRVAEEGKPQVIDQVSDAEKVPLEIALLVDVSGSVNPLFDFEKKAAAQFLRTVMKADDHATIFLIGDKPLAVGMRENAVQAGERLSTVVISGKFTAFYDTVLSASQYLQKDAPLKSRKVILALTDGEDNWSDLTREAEKATYRDVDVNTLTPEKRNQLAASTDRAHTNAQAAIRKALQNADTVYYSINPAGASYKLNKISQRAQTGMQSFADDTGGTAYTPSFQPLDTKDALQNSSNGRKNEAVLDQIFRQLAAELQAQYLIQYYSDAEFPNDKFVKLDVGLQNPANLRVRARRGYYVKN